MRYELRPYQTDAVNAAWNHIKTTTDSQVLELSTGAGKSLIIADLAHKIYGASKKKVLCLGPNKEIVEQNHEKYLLTGEPASIFSASAGRKCTRHPVVFGSPQSVKNAIAKFSNNYAAVIVDECFHPDTMVTTKHGPMKISDPGLKDCEIMCVSEETGDVFYQKPVRVYNSGTRAVSLLKTDRGETICTHTHKFYTGESWVKAQDLKPGQKIIYEDSSSSAIRRTLRAAAAVAKKLFQRL